MAKTIQLTVITRTLLVCVCICLAGLARAAESDAAKFYEQFDPKDHDRCDGFNTPERLAMVPKLAERFPDYVPSHANELFFCAAAGGQVSVCLWLADHGLNLGGEVPPMLALLRRAELVPVVKRLIELGASPDTEMHDGEFRGPLHAYAFTIRALDALRAMNRLEAHKSVLKRDVIRRNSGQPRRLVGSYYTGTEMATRGISLHRDGGFTAVGVGAELEGLWRSDGKTVELYGFQSDPTISLSKVTMTFRISSLGLVYDRTTFTKDG